MCFIIHSVAWIQELKKDSIHPIPTNRKEQKHVAFRHRKKIRTKFLFIVNVCYAIGIHLRDLYDNNSIKCFDFYR